MPLVRSVNVGMPREVTWAGIGRTSIDKHPVGGPVQVDTLGLDGDQISDTQHHGGIDQAVYAFAREDLDRWTEVLGEEIVDGQFGENLTTSGIDVNESEIGERWRIGGGDGVILEVASVRTPCHDFKVWMGRCGYDNTAWVKRFAAEGRPGPYLRVLSPGTITAGDELSVIHRPGHGVTVTMMFRALHTDRSLLPELLKVDRLVNEAREKAEAYVHDVRRVADGAAIGQHAR
ncbi:MAG: MOSC domain-containing protein [Nocardioides sp.]